MSKRSTLQLNVAAYRGDTWALSVQQHGALLLLLMEAHQRGGSVENQASTLARIVGVGAAKWRSLSPYVLPFCDERDGLLFPKQLQRWRARPRQAVKRDLPLVAPLEPSAFCRGEACPALRIPYRGLR